MNSDVEPHPSSDRYCINAHEITDLSEEHMDITDTQSNYDIYINIAANDIHYPASYLDNNVAGSEKINNKINNKH